MKFNDIFQTLPTATPATIANELNIKCSRVANVTRVTDSNNDYDLYGLSITYLSKLAGDDWPTMMNDPYKLRAFAKLVSKRLEREKGIRPANYTKKAKCSHCGDIWIFENSTENIINCPWCYNRRDGKLIPRPYEVACSDCQHFIKNQYTSSGVGECIKGVNKTACFAFSKRRCNFYLSK